MASRDFAHRRTTFSLVLWIFSVSWSTAMLLGAHTNTCLQHTTHATNVACPPCNTVKAIPWVELDKVIDNGG